MDAAGQGSPPRRRRFWEFFVARAFGTSAPRDKDYDEILALAAAPTDAAGKPNGSVALSAPGPAIRNS